MALSELTDLQMKRVRAAVWNRIPSSILITLYTVAFLALTAMGYAAGLVGSRTTLPTLMLVLAFSAIMVLIVDLERARQQLFRVTQEPMAEVARRKNEDYPDEGDNHGTDGGNVMFADGHAEFIRQEDYLRRFFRGTDEYHPPLIR